MIKMLQSINREDLETLWKLVKAKLGNTRPEEGYKRVLWGDLNVMFEPDVESKLVADDSKVNAVFTTAERFTTVRRVSNVRKEKSKERIKDYLLFIRLTL
ncbi:hypothetical protein Tco_1030397 [Tanacetum coccineum]|uniref:Uncharacterized protein n=1 Tax=Tanacetum coccineum TaxID=301880 RepID=A0ABQ5G6N4_9ASTR